MFFCATLIHAASREGNRPVVIETRSADEISFFEIPERLKALQISEDQFHSDLDALPIPANLRPVEAYGYHGGYLPALDELPEEPRWTLELKFERKVGQLFLVPALDHRFQGAGSYGFPRRFRVFKVKNTGERSVIGEWMDQDCPDPGAQSPLIIDLKDDTKSYIFEIEVYRGAQDGDRELFALDEVYGFIGQGLSTCTSVTASSEYESPPYWSKDYLVDRRTSFGLPTATIKQTGAEANDFMVKFDSSGINGCMVELDMGTNQPWNQITLLPAQPPEGILIPGYGFPRTLSISVIKEDVLGGRGRVLALPNTWGALSPGNNPVNISLARTVRQSRWIQLVFEDLPTHNGQQVFAMGEIIISQYKPSPIAGIRLEGFPLEADTEVHRMINGETHGREVLALRTWLEQLAIRHQLSQKLAAHSDHSEQLQLRWERTWQRMGLISFVAILVVGCVVVLFLMIQRRRGFERMKWKIAKEKQQTELEQMKLRFFTHISHELRTPLSVISGTVAKLEKEQKDTKLAEYSRLAQRNVKKLQGLVDQLLDFRKLQERKETLDWESVEIIRFIQNAFNAYQSLADDKSINYHLTVPSETSRVSIDCGKLQKIIDNLISNALKYTPEHGRVAVSLDVETNEGTSDDVILFEVRDSGAGIAADDLPHVFEQFYRGEGLQPIQAGGSGIGLALVKELIDLWGGAIDVVSPVGEGHGTCFSVRLPVGPQMEPSGLHSSANDVAVTEQVFAGAAANQSHSPRILLVEDNHDVRSFIRLELDEGYQLLEAEHGKFGIEVALDAVPDLIISDVMMPEMDGIELCRQLKTNELTSHIPIIMLTARSSEEHQIEGLENGADAYISKPFSMPVLLARIENLLESRRQLRARFGREVRVEPSAITVTSTDEQLLQRAIRIVEEHMDDCEFGVPELVANMHMARSTLFVKLRALVDQSPLEFIRTLRLKRARQLLEQSTQSIAEIAFQTGFAEPTNFSRSFKKQFGLTPTVFRDSLNRS